MLADFRWGLFVQAASAVFAAVAAGAAFFAAYASRSDLREERMVREIRALYELHDQVQRVGDFASGSKASEAAFKREQAKLAAGVSAAPVLLPECQSLSGADFPDSDELDPLVNLAGLEVRQEIIKINLKLHPKSLKLDW